MSKSQSLFPNHVGRSYIKSLVAQIFDLQHRMNEHREQARVPGATSALALELNETLAMARASSIDLSDCGQPHIYGLRVWSVPLNEVNWHWDTTIEGTRVKSATLTRPHQGINRVLSIKVPPGTTQLAFEYGAESPTTLIVESTGPIQRSQRISISSGFLQTVEVDLQAQSEESAVQVLCEDPSAERIKIYLIELVIDSRFQKSKQNFAAQVPNTEPQTLEDLDRLESLRSRWSGQQIFILGNGPSLNKTPLHLLEDQFVFGVNRVSLLLERVTWRPTFYTAFDTTVVPDNAVEFRNLDVEYKFFSARYKSLLGEYCNHYWYKTSGYYNGFEETFSPFAPSIGFGGGGTITTIAIELAVFLGFTKINLVGVDLSYNVPSSVIQTGPDEFNDRIGLFLQSTENDDSNHFDPRYFGKGRRWHNPNVREMRIGIARAAMYAARAGAVVQNATVGGTLDEIPRVDIEELVT